MKQRSPRVAMPGSVPVRPHAKVAANTKLIEEMGVEAYLTTPLATPKEISAGTLTSVP
jgi:hypothetical protein